MLYHPLDPLQSQEKRGQEKNEKTGFPGDVFLIGDGSKPWYLVNPKIAGKWMFITLKMYL